MDFLANELSKETPIFGLKLWQVVGLTVASCIALTLVFLSLILTSKKKRRTRISEIQIPSVSKEITVDEDNVICAQGCSAKEHNNFDTADRKYERWRSRQPPRIEVCLLGMGDKEGDKGANRGKHPCPSDEKLSQDGGVGRVTDVHLIVDKSITVPEVSHLGWGHWYTLRELEDATDSFSDGRVLGEGGYGIVYLGRLPDHTSIAVKSLLNNRGQAEMEFKVEVEAIGRVRHKNLVRLIGYCMEGSQRMLVYEYVDNGNLAQWLHGPLRGSEPLSWEIRMKIILGTAKGLAYLHEGLEPKVVHRDVKSSNILIDSQWNPKVSDFGLAKHLGADNTHVTTRVMGTFGYVAPEYAHTGMLTEKSDVYSYGVLVMELITGRVPVDYGRPPGEVNLVDWLKTMIGNRLFDEVADPKMGQKPSPRALKRALLVALRCVDPDANRRPKMSHVVHMLEADDNISFRDEHKNGVVAKSCLQQANAQTGTSSNYKNEKEIYGINMSKARWRYEG